MRALRVADGPWRKLAGERGQMTIELLVALPVALVIALVAFNGLTFFGLCAEYDRVARNAVRVYASAPTSAVSTDAVAEVAAAIEADLDCATAESAVEGNAPSAAPATYTCTLTYHPTLFGLGLRSEIFGVAMPALHHRIALSTFSYNPLF